MGLSLSKEQMGTKDACRRFTDEVIIPGAEELEAEDYPYRIMDGMAESGMMGIPFPGEYGGSGGDWVSLALCMKKSPGVMPASA